MPLHVELVSPERVLLSTDASMVLARTIGGGDIAFLPGHAPFIGALAVWVVEIIPVEGPRIMAAVHGGFISITDDRVKILSDLAELGDGIDTARAQAALERAEAAQARADDEVGVAEAIAAVARANARLRAAGALV
jgi:F-type H+-transporting ATPase subunit epsilon